MAEFIGGPVDERVINQLEARSEVLTRTAGNETFLKSRLFNNAWINVISSANLIEGEDNEKGAELAKRFILTGGTSTWNGQSLTKGDGIDFRGNNPNRIYSFSESKGVRPRPGITNFQIVSKNRFGAIREATVTFNVWNQEDLVNIERLYFRPGFHVIVEWGHTYFVDNDKRLQDGSTGILDNYNNFFTNQETPSYIGSLLESTKQSKDYNYDSFIGVIKNFSYSFRKDGGYDCVISIISKGEILDSIRLANGTPSSYLDDSEEKGIANINVLTFLVKVLNYDRAFWSNGEEDILLKEDLIKYIDDAVSRAILKEQNEIERTTRIPLPEGTFPRAQTPDSERRIQANLKKIELAIKIGTEAKKFLDTVEGNFIGVTKEINGKGQADDFTISFVPLSFVLDLINFQIELSLTDEQRRKIDVPKFTNRLVQAPMVVLEKSLILEPTTCLIYNRPDPELYPIKDDDIYNTLVNNLSNKSLKEDISNLFISSNLLFKLCRRYLGRDTRPEDSLAKDFIQDMMDEIGLALGNVNEFVITYDELTNTAFIEDKKTTPVPGQGPLQNKLPLSYTLPLTGLQSFITELSIQTKISNQLSSQIAIAAQGSSTDRDYNAYVANYKEWNRNLYDRFSRSDTVESPTEPEVPTTESPQETLASKRESFESRIRDLYEDFRDKGNYDPKDWTSIRTHGQTLYTQEEEYEDREAGRPPKGLIPTELSFTMDGIGGLKIGQSFKIQEGILPLTYNRYGYIITGLEHSIQNNKWYTMVRAQTFILQFEN